MREGGSGSGGMEGEWRKGTGEEGTELGMDGARERGAGGSDRGREGATERGRGTGRSVGGREIWREGNVKGCTLVRTQADIRYTLHTTTHNVALALGTLVLEMKNSEPN